MRRRRQENGLVLGCAPRLGFLVCLMLGVLTATPLVADELPPPVRLGAPSLSLGAGLACFTQDFARSHHPGVLAEGFAGYGFQDAFRLERFRVGALLGYSFHAAKRAGEAALHRGLLALDAALYLPLTPKLDLGLSMQVGLLYVSRLYGVGYDQGVRAALRWRLPENVLVELFVGGDLTDKKLFIKTDNVRAYHAFTETTLLTGLKVGGESLRPLR